MHRTKTHSSGQLRSHQLFGNVGKSPKLVELKCPSSGFFVTDWDPMGWKAPELASSAIPFDDHFSDSYHRVQRVRAKKVTAWLGKADTFPTLVVSSFLISPVERIMSDAYIQDWGKLLAMSAANADHAVTQCKEKHRRWQTDRQTVSAFKHEGIFLGDFHLVILWDVDLLVFSLMRNLELFFGWFFHYLPQG